MPFREGQIIVHPFHGPVRVDRIVDRRMHGKTVPYLQLTALVLTMDIAVPVHRAEQVGLRPVATPQQVSELLELLAGPGDPQPLQWSRRIKDFGERLGTGDIRQACYVIRELSRSGPKAPASAESQMLRQARSRLAVELSLALHVSEEEAVRIIDETCSGVAAGAA